RAPVSRSAGADPARRDAPRAPRTRLPPAGRFGAAHARHRRPRRLFGRQAVLDYLQAVAGPDPQRVPPVDPMVELPIEIAVASSEELCAIWNGHACLRNI